MLDELHGKVHEELPGRVYEEIPGRVGEEIPGRVGEDKSGRVDQEIPGRVWEGGILGKKGRGGPSREFILRCIDADIICC